MTLDNRPIANARYNEFGTIDLELNHPEHGWLPFTADPTDPEVHGRVIYARAIQGEAGPIAPYEPPPPPTEEEVAAEVRAERDRLLAATDWTQLPDVPQATKDLWAPYRQALRDVTEQPGFPHDIEWPEPPET